MQMKLSANAKISPNLLPNTGLITSVKLFKSKNAMKSIWMLQIQIWKKFVIEIFERQPNL